MAPSPRARASRVFAAMLVVGLGCLWAPRMAAAQAPGPYSGSADSDLVHAQALNIPEQVQLAEASVAPSVAEMSSTGVEGGGNSHSRATNLDVDVLSGTIPLTGLLVESEHKAPSAKNGPITETLAEVPADPLLNATIARTTANSQWNAAGCMSPGTPIATARSELADANVITGTEAGDALLALDNAEGDTVFSESETELVDVDGQTGKGVHSKTTTQLTAVTLFKGTPNQLTVNVLAPPVVEATANGVPGGAKVSYSEPILQIVDADGKVAGELNAAEANAEFDGSPLVKIRLGHLVSKVAKDGTSAEGNAVLFEVILLDSPGQLEPGLRLTVAGGSVEATVPSGGVDCSGGTTVGAIDTGGDCGTVNPLSDLSITSSAPTVQQGSTFVYTIDVSNNGDCELTDVKVEDTIDGPDGSEVVSTDPEADSVDGLTVVWNDVGPLAPGASKVLKVTVQVPAGAADGDSFSSDVHASATGGGGTFEQDASVAGPTVGSEVEVGGESTLPATGTYIGLLVLSALGLIAAGEFMRRRAAAAS
jgi:uncharacterized repeat protein (TIGR01451 family)